MSRVSLGPKGSIAFREGVKLKPAGAASSGVEMSVRGDKAKVEVDFDQRLVIIDDCTWVPFENVKHGLGGLALTSKKQSV